jgi:hypothetical protein
MPSTKEKLKAIESQVNKVFSATDGFCAELVPKDKNNHILVLDQFIAWKHVEKENARYGLRATVELHTDINEPKFYIMLFDQEIKGNEEAITDVFSSQLNNANLLVEAHAQIKGTGIMFDTKNYCDALNTFLKKLSGTSKAFKSIEESKLLSNLGQ